MEAFVYFLYRYLISWAIIPAVRFVAPFNKKLKQREGEYKRLQHGFEKRFSKMAGKKRVLFHCSSLGEWEQAIPVIEIIKKNNPGMEIFASFFSISGYQHVKDNPNVDAKLFLPFDRYRLALHFFKVLAPDLWVISAYDVWPNHVMAAKKLNIPVVIISATLSESSGRNKGLAKRLNKYVFKNIDAVYTRSQHDAQRFLDIFPFPDRISNFGDTRADRVYAKSLDIKKGKVPVIFIPKTQGELVFMAGSTWPADENVILPGLVELLDTYEHVKAVIVPHEIKEDHIRSIENFFKTHGMTSERYSLFNERGGAEGRVAIIDAIGVLAKLYKNTHIAFVGGSFGKGVHNVLEPSVFGMPVLFGPRHRNSQEAISLKELGATFMVRNTREFVTAMDKLITDAPFRQGCSDKALGYVKNSLGASGKIYQHLGQHFDFVKTSREW
jgi:3-deoxy-D-manno-octulosonic-acid transferase